jgi:MFS family permease
MLLVALALGVLALAGIVSAWTLLALTFLMGLGAALDGPAWQAVVADLVERQELASAVALNIVGFNVARPVGPALGGLMVAAAGPAAVFLLNAASFLCVLRESDLRTAFGRHRQGRGHCLASAWGMERSAWPKGVNANVKPITTISPPMTP